MTSTVPYPSIYGMENISPSASLTSTPSMPKSNASITLSTTGGGLEAPVMIPLYASIFLLSVIGNILVVFTLAQNRRMRTVTNVFLLNLAIADLLLGVFCMPFTLIGQLLRDFVFGAVMCKLIPYAQAVSVSVGVWTLVAISLERYFAICRPLRSRIWQTRSHAYKIISVIWVLSSCCCLPVAMLSQLKPLRGSDRHKCREEWPDLSSERAYNMLLVATLFAIPLLVMGLAYWLIAVRLCRGLQYETHNRRYRNPGFSGACGTQNNSSYPQRKPIFVQRPPRGTHSRLCCQPRQTGSQDHQNPSKVSRGMMDYHSLYRNVIRRTYTDKSIFAKKKVIRMLFVIVLEFFICWTPLYVINTWYAFDPAGLYKRIGPMEVSLVHLLAYLSSCCNPITYCFMNEKFRTAFLNAFGCRRPQGGTSNRSLASGSFSESTLNGRRSYRGVSGVKAMVLETSLSLLNPSAPVRSSNVMD